MSHAQSQRYPEGRATEPCPGSAASQAASRGCHRACAYMLHLPPAGVPLLRTGTAFEGAGFRWQYQDRFHCQALSDSNRQTPWVCGSDRADLERHRQPSCADVVKPRAKTWLKNRRMVSGWPFGWIIGLIACWLKSSLRLMNCWYPKGAGSLIAPISVVRRS